MQSDFWGGAEDMHPWCFILLGSNLSPC